MKKSHTKMFKIATSATLVASSVAIAVPIASANSFSDINSSQYFYADVLELSTRGIINGFPDGTFKPGNNLTRGQAAKMIAGILGLDTVNVVNPNFSDIPTTHQYYGAIAALKQAGIINGYPDGTFRQGGKIERNHVAKMIANAMNFSPSPNTVVPFTDLRQDYRDHIVALYERGITTGNTPTTFNGSAYVTRGQMAAFLIRAEDATNTNDTTLLMSTIASANTLLSTLTSTTDSAKVAYLQAALAAANSVLTNPNATQQQIDAAAATLQSKINTVNNPNAIIVASGDTIQFTFSSQVSTQDSLAITISAITAGSTTANTASINTPVVSYVGSGIYTATFTNVLAFTTADMFVITAVPNSTIPLNMPLYIYYDATQNKWIATRYEYIN